MEVTFYTFSKRRNSTLQPPAEMAGTVVDCNFKAQVQTDAPIFMLEWNEVPTWNYCKMMNYYYFIDDITIVRNNIYLIRCSIDVLATAKKEIGESSAYIMYSASKYDNLLVDNRLAKRPIGTWKSATTKFYPPLSLIGTFVLSAIGSGQNNYNFTTGFCRSYYMNYTEMRNFVNKLTSTDVWDALKQYFTDPLSAIADMYFIPFDISTFVDTVETNIILGNYDTGVSAHCLAKPLVESRVISKNITIPHRYEDFRDCSDYVKMIMYHPLIGIIPLAATDWMGYDSLECNTYVDFHSGAVNVELRADEAPNVNPKVHVFSGNCRVNLPYGRGDSRIGQLLSAIPAVTGAVASTAVGDIAGTASNLGAVLTAFAQPQSTSLNGSFSGSYMPIIADTDIAIYTYSYDTVSEPSEYVNLIGRPFMRVDKIGNHSGYIQTENASISTNFESKITDRINSYLNGGIFYE